MCVGLNSPLIPSWTQIEISIFFQSLYLVANLLIAAFDEPQFGHHTNSMPLPKKLDPHKNKKNWFLIGRESNALDLCSYNGSFTYSVRLSFQVQIEQEQYLFTITKLKTVRTGVFDYQPKITNWIIDPYNSKSRCSVDQDFFID